MFQVPLPEKDTALLLVPRFGELEAVWQTALLATFLLVPVALVVWLYRYELRLVSRPAAGALLTLRVLLMILLWFTVALQPIVAHYGDEEQKSRLLIAVDRSASMDVADPQRSREEKLRLARALGIEGDRTRPAQALEDELCDKVDRLTRREIARQILSDRFVQALQANHDVQLLGFHHEIWEDRLAELFKTEKSAVIVQQSFTDLNLPLGRALEESKRSRVAGVLLLSDGQHNAGPSPVKLARELGERHVPVYTLALGSRTPPADIAVLEVKAPANVFPEVDVPIEARVKVSGLPAQDVVVELRHKDKPGAPLQTRTIQHKGGARAYSVRFAVPLEDAGTHVFEVKAKASDPQTREITRANNALPAVIRVARDKARLLLVDGEARWEYHYLANAFSRDKAVTADRVLFVQPRIGAIPEDKLEKTGNPRLKLPVPPADKQPDPLFAYDCIILGDVAPEQLPLADRRRLERFVSDRGGTLILQAGKRFLPADYFKLASDDPLVKLLPITRAQPLTPTLGFSLKLTTDGNLANYMQIESSVEENSRRWQELPRHYWGTAGRPRPGATVLAVPIETGSVADDPERTRGLIVQQNYGLGRVLYVGIESTWRWRYKVGDLYHHRFWGQVVRWAAADKLLPAGNRLVRYGSREPVYQQGQPVDIAVRLDEEVPIPASNSSAQLVRLDKDMSAAVVPLQANKLQPRLLTGQVRDLAPGTYRIDLESPEFKAHLQASPAPGEKTDPQPATFTILPPGNRELADLATNWSLLESLAAQSKGEVLTPETVDGLVQQLVSQTVRQQPRQDGKLWQDEPWVWYTLAVFLLLVTLEWLGRKIAGLP